jgi:hypothetical protein
MTDDTPRPSPRPLKRLIQVRLADSGIDKMDSLAEEYGLTRTDVIRAALSVAFSSPMALAKALGEIKGRL